MKRKRKPKNKENKENRPIFITGLKFCLYYGLIYDNRFWLSAFSVVFTRIVFVIGAAVFLGPIVTKMESLDLPELVNLLHYVTFNSGGLFMSFTLLIKSNQFIDFCKLLEDEFKFPKVNLSPLQENIMKDSSAYLVSFIKIMAPFYYLVAVGNALRGPLLEGTPLPYKGWLPFDIDTWPKYCLAFFIETLMALNVTSNFYISLQAYVIHGKQLCTQFEILCSYIKTIFEYYDAPSTSNSSSSHREEFIKLKIAYAVERHQVLIRCFHLFQELYNGLLFGITLLSGLVVCTNIFMITDPNTNAAVILDFLILLAPELVVIMFYCWYGQKITDRWEDVRSTVYEIDWFNESISTRRSLLNIMLISTKDKIVKGGGLQAFNMEGYKDILNASFSYFNMLKAMR